MKRFKFITIFLFLLIALVTVSCQDEETDILPLEENGVEVLITAGGIEFVRTPEAQFENLPDWPYEYKYLEIDGLRQAYAETGPVDGEVVLLLHGQPSWSYLYRKMIPVLADAGYRVIAMDHLGMGRSDKPIDINDYTYLSHTDRLERFITGLGLQNIHLFVQDWGSLIGLKVAGENTDWFASIAVGNGGLPILPSDATIFPIVENPNEVVDIPSVFNIMPAQQPSFYDECDLLIESDVFSFGNWMEYAMKSASFHAAEVIEFHTYFAVPEQVLAAYDAPYPERLYMAGIRKLPSLINEVGGNTEDATHGLSQFEKPFITIWGGNDIGNLGSCESQQYFIDLVPGAQGLDHVRLPKAGHFLQDDQGVEIATRLVKFFNSF
jgi:haloalkane dehalogenase